MRDFSSEEIYFTIIDRLCVTQKTSNDEVEDMYTVCKQEGWKKEVRRLHMHGLVHKGFGTIGNSDA